MKPLLCCLFLLVFALGFSKTHKTAVNPMIGIKMSSVFMGQGSVYFSVSVKNTGEETLNNITIALTEDSIFGTLTIYTPLPESLAPGQEVINMTAIKTGVTCYDVSQLIVRATTAGGAEITDLSSDIHGYDNNGLPGSYYNDFENNTIYQEIINANQNGIYADLNGNNIIDVGDAINYTYSISNFNPGFYPNCEIVDDNAIVATSMFDFNDFFSTTGIHYLTQEDVNLGYIYNSSYVMMPASCQGGAGFQDATYCNGCPNPMGANIITKLTSLLPNKISGKVKFNANNDCATAFNFPSRRVATSFNSNEYATFTNASGDYSILIPNSGDYTTNALSSLNSNFSSTPASVVISSLGENINYSNTDFCIASGTNYTDLRVNMFNVDQAIPGFPVTYRLYYENIGSTALSGSVTLAYSSSKLASVTVTPVVSSEIGDVLTWDFTNLLPFERRYIELNAMVLPPPVVNSGDTNTMIFTGNPIGGDSNIANNIFTLNQPVFSSFDPNDKTVLEGENITAAQAAGYLNYVTRFQNTGTANATTVVVKETLDPDLDWSTFEPIDASHAYNIQIKNSNQLTYTFSNIGLPFEAANEAASHGWLAYRIKPKSTFSLGDVASSTSDIYFDFNPPVITNTVNTQLAVLSSSNFLKNNFCVYPNPAKDFITIQNRSNLASQYEILSANGQSLMKNTIESSKTIDIGSLQNGFYFITLKAGDGQATYKFIKN